ncbi:DUF4825 domain-containing protein [Peptoniphilaceae bacterium SGI.137]
MSRKLECEIIRDLLPTYVDGQTSDVTNMAIKEHISECHECAEVLRRMKEPEEGSVFQEKEINYLKKVKKSKRSAAWVAAAIALVFGMAVLGLFIFVRGTETDINAHDVSIQVEDGVVYAKGNMVSSGEGVARVSFTEKEGVVDIHLFTAPAMPFNRGSFSETYTAKADYIKAITSGGVVLWENGETISRLAGRLYAARNPYIGDISANLKIADALHISERYGAYKNELQTSKEPYGWIIILEEPIDPSQETKTRQKMLSDACLIIASVDNLGTVTWRYENGSGRQEYTITEAEATKNVGANIKSYSESASKIQKLVEIVR